MNRLSTLVTVLLISLNSMAQSPHGDKLNFQCDMCHTAERWIIKFVNNPFDHNLTSFSLIGQHKTIDCRKCHPDLVFSNATTICISCHKDVHQQTVGQDCERCHTPISWGVKNIVEIHQKSRFPLNGQHAKTDCYKCHKSASLLRFDPMETSCIGCHSKDYLSTSQPSHTLSRFPKECLLCHSEITWQPANFNHNVNTTFPLTGGHLGITCNNCHVSGYTKISTACLSCHLPKYNASTNPGHIAARFSTECKTCHTVNSWKPALFDHSISTTFPLTGGHTGVSCIACHAKGYANTPTGCSGCHLSSYNATTNPGHITAKFSTDCTLCHNETSWKPSFFNHNTATTFPLQGSHIGVTCIGCHPKSYAGTASDCASCHLANYNATTSPSHITAKYSLECKVCHSVNSWKPTTYNHTSSTTFPLTGGHTGVPCISCHLTGYAGISTACVSCHLPNYNATLSPNHNAAKFSTDCKTCHTETGWKPSSFNHDTNTSFALTGAHIGVACATCHTKNYAGNSKECVSCHLINYNSTITPSHVAARYPTNCAICHTSTDWKPSIFDHNTTTAFPLTGAHAAVNCISCHSNGYAGTLSTCVSCHLINYNATTSPGHVASKFSTDCKICHVTNAWRPAEFDHTVSTSFPLTGAHIGVSCASCHSKGYIGISSDCVSCHLNDFNLTTTPSHVAEKYPTDCKICHKSTGWKPSYFDHNVGTAFPLTGAHIGVACISCHTSGYVGTSTECVSCHLTNYNATSNPGHIIAKISTDCKNCHTITSWMPSTFSHRSSPIPQGVACVGCHLSNYNNTTNPAHFSVRFSTDCETCHSVSGWAPASFNHTSSTTFPLTGAHIAVTCISCHSTGYTGISTACFSCHLANYNATSNPVHSVAKFPTTCEMCHTSTSWAPATFNHNTATTFPLKGAHIGVGCNSCHTNGYAGIPTTCVSCHLVNYNASINPPHLAGKFSTDCKTCHTESAWSSASFNHSTGTTFPLTGAHVGIACINCHAKGYIGISMACSSCHLTNYNATTSPGHVAAKFPTTCETCHTTTGWTPSTFNHNTSTSFPLAGAHIALTCISCHANGYAGIATTCVSCHLTNYNSSINPPHLTGKFSTDCKTCHTSTGWSPATFNHSTATTFPLTGAHTSVTCIGCHTNGYAGISTACSSCHLSNYNSTTNPGHLAAKFPITCETCHTTKAWTPSTFNHNSSTTFPLAGAHVGLACISCHANGYAGIATTCVSCHLGNYNASVNPPHQAGKFSTDCKTCHTSTAWSPATFNHTTGTTFSLTGAHIRVACISCHSKGYAGISTACTSCHLTNYNSTTNPGHVAAKFPTTCETCHTTTAWSPATFNHTTGTTFPLTGAHVGVACISCHANGYSGIATTCVSCHLSNYNASANPPHLAGKFSTDCKACHTVTAWSPATFNHSTGTTFPLTGAHIGITCLSCHSKGYVGISTACTSCHLTNYNATTNPGHVAAKFPTTCETCHTTKAWSPATFNHTTGTTFPLTGAHIGVTCISCHSKGYVGILTTCVSCHLTNYNASTSPGHVAAKFSTDCKTCHTTTAWAPSTFNHTSGTTFPLTGSHLGVACINCHSKGYAGISTACSSCHLTQYNSTTNPAHAAAKFPTTCESCHTVTVWTTSTFNHDTQYFRIYSGKHNGEWNLCSDCHTTATNFAVFNCLTCHAQSSTNSKHSGVSGYTYNSTNCYSCHPKV